MSTQIKSVPKEAARESEFDEARSALAAQIDTIKTDLASLADAVRHVAVAGGGAAKAEATRRASDIARGGEGAARAALAKAEGQKEAALGFARREPALALAAAAGAGLLIGLFASSRR